VAAEARYLTRALEARVHRASGFSSFGDFVREVLQLAPRTARRRVRLHRALEATTALRDAFEAGELSPCQILILAPVVNDTNAPFWIELAANLTVRGLTQRVREAEQGPDDAEPDGTGTEDAGPEETAAGVQVTFAAPLSAAVTWDLGIEAARQVLGWDAPVPEAVAAILAEAEGDLATVPVRSCPAGRGEPAGLPSRPSEPPPGVGHDLPREARRFASPLHARAVRKTLARLERELAELEDTIGREEVPQEAGGLVHRLRDLQLAERPLRLLEGRLLRDLDASGALEAIGFENLAAFVERYLGHSERTARSRLAECHLFDDEPVLARAFEEGRIGVGAAFLIRRVMLGRTLPAWIRRAEQVTHLQLAREVRLVERLWECAPDLAARCPGPLPQPGLEEALETFAHEAHDPCPDRDPDPARDPRTLARLEALLDAGALGRDAGDPVDPRQTLAAGRTGVRAERMTTISFWASEDLQGAWNHAMNRLRTRWGPLPTWVSTVLLVEHALSEWWRVDPSRRPRESSILERDGYRCQAPGCSARRNLEVHHIVFRSLGGSDAPDNKITLCHAHHRRGIHEGTVRVEGRAPGALMWELRDLRFEGHRHASPPLRRPVDHLGNPENHHLHPDRGQDEPHETRDHGQPVLAQELDQTFP